MKKILVLILAIQLFLLASCVSQNTEMPDVNLLIYSNSENIDAYRISVSEGELVKDSEKLYSYRKEGQSIEDAFPLKYGLNSVVLKKTPYNINVDNYYVDDTNGSALYYDNYCIVNRDSTWTLADANNEIGIINLEYNNVMHNPVSFSIVDDRLMMLCVTSAYVTDIELVVITYDLNTDLRMPIDYKVFEDVWANNDISQINCPNRYNVVATDDSFLYNEGQRIFEIPYETKDFRKIADEDTAKTHIPYFDSQRESYAFFNDCGKQNGIYIVSFSAFNRAPGTYVEFISSDGELLYYMHITQSSIVLYDNESNVISELQGDYMTHVTIS